MIRPAQTTTHGPPVKIESVELQEYINELRRRIEVQNVLLEELAKQVAHGRQVVEKQGAETG
jgi:hypothetical protein